MNRTARRTFFTYLFGACLLGLPVHSYADSQSFGSRAAAPDLRLSFNAFEMAALIGAPAEGEGEAAVDQAEGRELTYKTINFLILVVGLALVLRKPLGGFLASRSAEIHEGLEEGRQALATSQARLSAIEEKLRHLEEEVAAFKAAAIQEMQSERERMRLAAAAEADKMLESARSRMETTVRAAKLELRFYIAGEALKQAEQIIRSRLDDATRGRLVQQFVTRLETAPNQN